MPVERSLLEVSGENVLLFSFLILGVFFSLFVIAIFTYRLQNQKRVTSPYSGRPMRRGEDIPLSSVEMIMKFLYYEIHSFDNRVFPMKRAVVCRETGRIFPYSISWWGFYHVDWTFIQERYPGVYVSWGSLSHEQQQEVIEVHESLEGFQVEHSCSDPLPQNITRKYCFLKPGPLYVDLNTKVLIGWKCVPDTIFEVLIVQKPKPNPKPIDRIITKKE
ncbi:MAG: hypothetical protein AAGG81_07795 [Chlamydiota bacterium]